MQKTSCITDMSYRGNTIYEQNDVFLLFISYSPDNANYALFFTH